MGIFKAILSLELFNTKKISLNELNTAYSINNGEAIEGKPEILFKWIVFIELEGIIWTRGNFYCKEIKSDLVKDTNFISEDNHIMTQSEINQHILNTLGQVKNKLEEL